ncbi:MAG: glycosyltransferase family 2 protein [Actinobacteria bacterium]|nr:MAG: glycosyltransferase family 2 protein [Actinomycetota bacterium]
MSAERGRRTDRAATGKRAPVSVIVPVHGFAPYLAETLDGILEQEPAPAELIVVDDASAEPLELGEDYLERCRVVRRERRGGLATARATGLTHAGGELIALCDDDDTWEPGSLAARLAALDEHPDADVCFGRAVIVGPDDRPTGERWPELAPGLHAGTALLTGLYEHNPIPVSSAIIRADALAAAGGLDGDLARAEDWDLWLRLAARGAGFVFAPEAVVRYRRRPGALSGDVAELARAQLLVHERHGQLVPNELYRRVRARDLAALAAGLTRERRYSEARVGLIEAARTGGLSPRDRARMGALALPGARGLMGRRDPYLARSRTGAGSDPQSAGAETGAPPPGSAEVVTCSRLDAAAGAVWSRVTTFEGINDELRPWMTMTAPARVRERGLAAVVVGRRLCRSWVLLGGVLPFDYDDITLVRLEPGVGFVERSPMLSQRYWEHERTLRPEAGGTLLCDRVRFCPRPPLSATLVRPLIAAIFRHRHRRLRVHFGGREAAPSPGLRS